MRLFWFFVLSFTLVAGLVGCNVSKPYIIKVDRTDQDLPGNKGYLKGTPPSQSSGVKQRELIAVDIDLPTVKGKPAEETKLISGGKTIDILPPTATEETK